MISEDANRGNALSRRSHIGWLYSALGAVAIAAGLALGALQLIDK